MNGLGSLGAVAAAALLLVALGGASRPTVLANIDGGLWEVAGAPGGPKRLCVPEPTALSQFEHRSSKCTRETVRDTPLLAEIHYSCSAGGFGQSTISAVTPRSLRIETQGISAEGPFHYVLQARRIGNC